MKAEHAELLQELERLTSKMDVPTYRRRNVRWLERNLALRNADRPEFQRAKEIIGELLQNGIAA